MSSDPQWHQQRELELLRHFETLLTDRRFVVDTTEGRRAVTQYRKVVAKNDRSAEVKRRMMELGSSDFGLQRAMPGLPSVDVELRQTRWLVFEKLLGQVKLITHAPVDDLILGKEPSPLDAKRARAMLSAIPGPAGKAGRRVPQTIVLLSTSGFDRDTLALAERLSERTVILVEPNASGGWTVHGTPETKGVLDALDPEPDDGKKRRIRDAIASSKMELASGGLGAERLAARLGLPLDKIERELKAVASETPGLSAKRFDGRLVLYRDAIATVPGAKPMPVIDKLKAIFTGGDPIDKKVAFLSERRAAITQQRDVVQDELLALENHEGDLKEQFKKNDSTIIRRRLTTQMLQLRKDIERKAQMLQMLNQQIDVAGGYLHNLELIKQGNSIKLPAGEDMAEYAAKAEEVLAELQAEAQVASELTGQVSTTGMTDEEQALYEELMKDVSPKQADTTSAQPTAASNQPTAANPQRESAPPLPPVPEKKPTPQAN